MIKDILVLSCERSGTHFLIDSIIRNYPQYGQFPRVDVPASGDQAFFHKFFEDFEYGKGRIVKSHHQWEFFKPIWNEIKDKFYVIYIIREGKDVMTSWHYYFNKAPRHEFPFTKNVGDLMRKNPQNFTFDLAYSKIRSNTMVERWARHIASYLGSSFLKTETYLESENGILFLTYEDLYCNYNSMIPNIGLLIGNIHPRTPLDRPTPLTGTGVAPRKGIIGDWMNHFNTEDEKFFYNEVSKVTPELYGRIFKGWKNNRLQIEYISNRGHK